MSYLNCPIVVFPGAGGGVPDLAMLRASPDDTTPLQPISYPGWKRYVTKGYSADSLIADLAQQVTTKVPDGPICIVGLSIGGHFGYAVALHLQTAGRNIVGFCAIDSEMFASSAPTAGWMGRALGEALELVRHRRFVEFNRFLRSRLWRAMLRSTHGLLPNLLHRMSSLRRSSPSVAMDPLLEEELSMRLLIEKTAPWVVSIDREPIALRVPSVLLRRREAARHDAAWSRRCPDIEILEVPGQHHTLWDPENVLFLHEAFISATRSWSQDRAQSFAG